MGEGIIFLPLNFLPIFRFPFVSRPFFSPLIGPFLIFAPFAFLCGKSLRGNTKAFRPLPSVF
jgi:hypothetical protein